MTSNVIVPQAMFSISSKYKQHLVGDEWGMSAVICGLLLEIVAQFMMSMIY